MYFLKMIWTHGFGAFTGAADFCEITRMPYIIEEYCTAIICTKVIEVECGLL